VTHPFHPLRGREFELADHRSAWGEGRVYVYGDRGQLVRLPDAWTDFGELDPFVVISGGRSPLHIEALVRLVELVAQVAEGRGCQVNPAVSVRQMTPERRAPQKPGKRGARRNGSE